MKDVGISMLWYINIIMRSLITIWKSNSIQYKSQVKFFLNIFFPTANSRYFKRDCIKKHYYSNLLKLKKTCSRRFYKDAQVYVPIHINHQYALNHPKSEYIKVNTSNVNYT